MKKIAIIGGGISGLAATYALEKEIKENIQLDYTLYESEKRLGGKIWTEKKEGFILEGGPDTFVSTKPETIDLAKELGIGNQLINSSQEKTGTYIYSKGGLHQMPEGLYLMIPTRIGPFLTSGLFSWPGKIRMALDLVIPRRSGEGDETLASFIRRRLGQEALEKIAEPLVAGIHASDPEKMSLKSTFPSFLDMEKKYGSLIRAMIVGQKKMKNAAKASMSSDDKQNKRPKYTFFVSFKEGMGQIVETIRAKISQDKIKLENKVNSIKYLKDKKSDEIKYILCLEDGIEKKYDPVIITTASLQAAELLKNLMPTIANELSTIPWSTSATINLAFMKNELSEAIKGYGFVVPQVENRKIMAGTFCTNKFQGRSPEDKFLIRVFIGGSRNQDLVELDDNQLERITLEELDIITGLNAKPLFSRVFRWFKGMPQYVIGHQDMIKRIEEELIKWPGLYLAGGSYHGVGTSDCIRTGRHAAQMAKEFLINNSN